MSNGENGCCLTPNALDAQKGQLTSAPQSPAIQSSVAGQHQDYQPLGSKPMGGGNLQ
jgi:hypothetical protein